MAGLASAIIETGDEEGSAHAPRRENANVCSRRGFIAGGAALLSSLALGSVSAGTIPAPLFRGVNLAGGEFGGALPGRLNWDYIYPSNEEVDYYRGEGMNTFRVPIRWERIQPTLGGNLHGPDMTELDRLVRHATGTGAFVILDAHNYGRRRVSDVEVVVGETSVVLSSHFANFWRRLATRYASNRRVIFGLMNEPHDQDTKVLVSVLNYAIRAIRDTGARNRILVPGNAWSGAHSWIASGNGKAMLQIRDPLNRFAFDVHQYLDHDSSGTNTACIADAGASRLQAFTEWARANRKRGFLGEFGAAANPGCLAELRTLLAHMQANTDVWIGWTYWAGGPWWGDYPFSIEPASLSAPVRRPQMNVLARFL